MRPQIGSQVLYFPDDERRRNLGPPLPARVWPAVVTFVHDREYDKATGEAVGPWLVSLSAFPPPALEALRLGTASVMAAVFVPLAGMYDLEDLLEHPQWIGCWNWPPPPVLE